MSSSEQAPEPIIASSVNTSPVRSANEHEKPRWSKPEISSFKPITDTEGISYTPSDGISNMPFSGLPSGGDVAPTRD
jgi:hypothetical protein